MSDSSSIDLSSLKEKVRADRASEPGSAWPTWLRVVLTAAVAVGVPTGLGWLTLRPDYAQYPLFQMSMYYSALLVGLVALAWRANRPLHRVYRSDAALWIAMTLGVSFVLAITPFAHRSHPAVFMGGGDSFVPLAAGCFIGGAVVALVPVLAALLIDRARQGVGDGLLMAALIGGLAGNAYLLLHCPSGLAGHRLASHATIGVFFLALAGVWWVLTRPKEA